MASSTSAAASSSGSVSSPGYMKPVRKRSAFSRPLTFVLTIVAIIFLMSFSFRVEVIEVVGNSHYTKNEIINAIDIEQGDNLFFFDRFAAITRVFAKLPYVSEVNVARSLPNKVTITVTESAAVAYIELGSELWTMDENGKVLGTAAEGEAEGLIPIVGFDPGTFFINETVSTATNDTRTVDYLKEILYQIVERGMMQQISKIDFTSTNNVTLSYMDKYTIRLGDPYATEHKFALFISAANQLKDGDIGIIDVTDASTVHFIPY